MPRGDIHSDGFVLANRVPQTLPVVISERVFKAVFWRVLASNQRGRNFPVEIISELPISGPVTPQLRDICTRGDLSSDRNFYCLRSQAAGRADGCVRKRFRISSSAFT
jgi:hypothetical protein